MPHPREGWKVVREALEQRTGRRITRREMLRYTAGAAVSVPALSAILAACGGNPRERQPVGTGGFQVATPDNPVTLPLVGQPIPDGLEPETGATLQIFNWDQYIWKRVVEEFCVANGCDYEITTFNNMEDAVSRITTGDLKMDIFFPTYDVLGKLVHGGFLQPLNHSYVPNLEASAWSIFANPFYDQGWQYSVPYTVYTTGMSYRRDVIPDDLIYGMSNPWEILWDPQYSGKVGVYDSYRDTIAMALLKNGITDVNTERPEDIEIAKNDLIAMIDAVNVRATINGSYARLPKGYYDVHLSWSGDIVAGWGYVSEYTDDEFRKLGYWFPEDRVGVADNDLITIPSTAEHPVLAHAFLNWMLDFTHAMDNFSWNGYQPPQREADVTSLTSTEGRYSAISKWAPPITLVPEWMPNAVVLETDLTETGYRLHELSPEGDQLWNDAWQQFKAGV
jgi:spermidine/putrescine transport system substrate-binding protein